MMQKAVVGTAAILYGAQASSGIGRDLQCRPGTRQLDPIVLGCAGGSAETQVTLSPAGTKGSSISWNVAQGSRDFYVAMDLSPMAGLTGDADLSASCNRTPMVGKLGSVLTPAVLRSHIVGADWSWSGDDTSVPIREWIDVSGPLGCELTLFIQNHASTALSGTVSYSWAGVIPCPDLLPGCQRCFDSQCAVNRTVVCDGSAAWSCSTQAIRNDVKANAPPLVEDTSEGLTWPHLPLWFYIILACVALVMVGAACLPALLSAPRKGRKKAARHTRTVSLDGLPQQKHRDLVLHEGSTAQLVKPNTPHPYGEALSREQIEHDQRLAAIAKRRDMEFGYNVMGSPRGSPGGSPGGSPRGSQQNMPVMGVAGNPFQSFPAPNQYHPMQQTYAYAGVPSPYGPAGPPPY